MHAEKHYILCLSPPGAGIDSDTARPYDEQLLIYLHEHSFIVEDFRHCVSSPAPDSALSAPLNRNKRLTANSLALQSP